jgi:hypothetical protein
VEDAGEGGGGMERVTLDNADRNGRERGRCINGNKNTKEKIGTSKDLLGQLVG